MKSYSCDSRESRFIFTAKLIKSSLCSSFFIQLHCLNWKKYLKQLVQVKTVLFYYTFLMNGRIYSLSVQTRQLDTECNTCAQWLSCIICPSLIFCLQHLWAIIFLASSVPIELLDAIIFITYISSIFVIFNAAIFNSLNWIHFKFKCWPRLNRPSYVL